MSENIPQGLKADLQGQVAIVTGASRGLGKAMAEALAASGARVACVARNQEKLAETVKAIEDAGGQAEACVCDVTDREAVDQLVDQDRRPVGSSGHPGQQCRHHARHAAAADER